jgi:hypothetical protein
LACCAVIPLNHAYSTRGHNVIATDTDPERPGLVPTINN